MEHRRPRTLIGAAAVAAAILLAGAPSPAVAAAGDETKPKSVKPRFSLRDSSAIQGIKLYDLGVADANGDGNLDVFTVNHKFDSSFLLGDGLGGLTESTTAIGLNPTPEFPGFEALRRDPPQTSPGLYIYATDRDQPRDPLRIDPIGTPASGRIVFGSEDLRIEATSGAQVTKGTTSDGYAVLEFEAEAGQAIDVTVDHIDLPISVSIDPPIDPGSIRVGADAVPATSSQFELNLRDRHGYAFGDFEGDGQTDLFIASGGLGGDISEPFFTPLARDELLFSRSGRYLNGTEFAGLVKGDCRGRAAEVADLDLDGDLDLLETCEGATPRVHLGDGLGRFTQAPGPPALGTAYRLLDTAGDRRPELLAANGNLIGVWSYAATGWVLIQEIVARNVDFPIESLGLGDVEGDGDLDVLATSAGGSTILRAGDGRLERLAPGRLGLPETSRAGALVDFDNDGDLDVHLMPQGLYEQVEGRFEPARTLGYPNVNTAYAIDNWVDLDNDGRREPLTARGRDEFAASQEIELRRNRTRGGHWLELDLVGPAKNRQAIGAEARVKLGERRIHQWVGQNDDARFSSGHNRLYFGLGADRRVDRLTVSWPDGKSTRLGPLRGDRLLRISYSGAVRRVR